MLVRPLRFLLSTSLLAAATAAPALAQPQISQISPASAVVGSGDFTLVIDGAGFGSNARVQFNGAAVQGASVTPTRITVRVPNQFITSDPWVMASDFRDGVATKTVIVINGPASDDPSAVAIFRITQPGVGVATTLPKAILTGVEPSPAQPGGTLTIAGDNFDAPNFTLTLLSADPNAAMSSYGLTRRVVSRAKSQVQVSLEGVPAGSYTLVLETADSQGANGTQLTAPVVVGAPTRLAPRIAAVGPTPLRPGDRLSVRGERFAADARVTLVGAAGDQPLERAPNSAATATTLTVVVPAGTAIGAYTVRVENPGTETPAAEFPLQVTHAEQAQLDRATAVVRSRGAARPERPRSAMPRPAPAASAPAYNTAITAIVGWGANAKPLCLVPEGDHDRAPVKLRPCAEGGAMYQIENGYVRTAGGRCLDWGDEGGPIHLMPCQPGNQSQVWYFHGNNLVQNALRDHVCMDVAGRGETVGTAVVAYRCQDYKTPAANQRFHVGQSISTLALGVPLDVTTALARATEQHRGSGYVQLSNGYYVVAAGGANVVAAGGANVVAAGGANAVAAGGANVIVVGGSGVVAAGGLNLIGAAGGNVVAAGGLNLIPPSQFSSLFSGARVVAAGGAN